MIRRKLGLLSAFMLSLWVVPSVFSSEPSWVKTPIRILNTSAEAENWERALKELGCGNVKIIAERDRPLDEAKKYHKGEDLAAGSILIAPNSWIEGYYKVIDDFVKGGGRVIATKAAGYCEGNFYLTELLRAGKRNMAIPILYPAFIKDDEAHSKFTRMAQYCIDRNPDGVAIFEYCGISMKRWKSAAPDMGDAAKETFSSFDRAKKNKASLTHLGMPAVPKIMYVSAGVLRKYPISPEDLVASVAGMGANVIDITLIGSVRYPLYDSEYPCAEGKVSGDYLPRLIKLAEAKGIQVWANIGFSPNAYGAGSKRQEYQSGKPGSTFCALASGDWYRANCLPVVKELLSKHPYINVLTLDEPRISVRSNIDWCCFCERCKAGFKAKYGRELTADLALSKEFMEFRTEVMTECLVRPLAEAINEVNPVIRLGCWTWPSYEMSGIDPAKCGDAGLTIYGPEYMFEHYGREGRQYVLDGEDETYLQMERGGFSKHGVQLFDFKGLKGDAGHKLLRNVGIERVSGTGVKLDAFNGAQVIAWMADGRLSYPGIVSANDGRTLYFSFDPASLNTRDGIAIIKNSLDFLCEGAK